MVVRGGLWFIYVLKKNLLNFYDTNFRTYFPDIKKIKKGYSKY